MDLSHGPCSLKVITFHFSFLTVRKLPTSKQDFKACEMYTLTPFLVGGIYLPIYFSELLRQLKKFQGEDKEEGS